jgi:hypothetical protein
MNQADRLLRATIAELAGEMSGPSHTLAATAIAQGRRMRRRHRLALMGVAVVACAGIAAPSAVVAAHRLSAASDAHTLPGGWIVLGKGDQVYDRRSGAFVTVPHTGGEAVQPAPAGRRVLVYTPPKSLQFIDVDGSNPVTVNADSVLGGAPFSGDPFSATFQWSPAGDRVLATIDQKEPFQMGFAIIDAQTGKETKHWIDHGTPAEYDCSECSFTWTRDGKQVVLPIADRSGGEARDGVQQLQLFDATTGAPTRTLPVPAAPTGPFSWSPDGRYVLAKPDPMASQLEIIDAATGTSRPFPYTQAVWATNDRLLATNATTVYTLTRAGTAIATMTVNLGAGHEPITVGPPS